MSAAIAIVALTANLSAFFLVPGKGDNLQIGLVTFGCICGLLLQFRTVGDELRLRLRLGCHLVYYYALVWLGTLTAMAIGLFTIDLLNQSILQSQPLTELISELIGREDLTSAGVDTLSLAQRYELRWVYVAFAFAAFFVTLPFTLVTPYYNVWILQRIHQDLRLALV